MTATMKKFVLFYYGHPQLSSPEEMQAHRGRWEKWAASLGDAIVEKGVPVHATKTVTQSGAKDSKAEVPLTGYTVVQARSMEEAVEMTRKCPFVEDGGRMDVAEAMSM